MVDIVTRAGKGSPLTNNEVDANFTNLAEVAGVTGEPMGHEDRTTSTISFNASTRTFTIAPVSSSFTVWCKGKKVVVSSAQTVTIPNTTGMHSIYYDANGTLLSKIGYFSFSTEAPTAYVYWNATTGAAPYFGDERHGVVLDWQTHEYLHRTRGAAIANGFLASGYTLNNSATNAATQIAIESGTFFDEDMKIDIVSTATPTAGTYQQNLLFPAKIPVLHLQGTSWVMDAPTDFPFKQGTSRPQYNSLSGGVWSTTDVGNNQHATTWILATNNLTYPVIAIIGQSATDSQGEAESFSFADLTLTGFPSVEFRPLYKLVYKASDAYVNSVNAQLVSIVDLRSVSAVGAAANPATDHGNLSGLSDDDHPQYLSVDTVRGTLTAAVKASFLPAQTGNAGKFLTTDATSTSWTSLTSGNITTALGFTPYNATNPNGYITGITSSNVTTALGFTPYNATNPSGYITTAGARNAISVTGAGSYDPNTGVINVVGGVTSFNTRTGAITLSSADVTTALGFTPYNSTNPSGYITGITSGMVTTALGYTPYNSSNPSGYITSSALSNYLPLSGGTLSGALILHSAAGTNGFYNGTGDGASFSTYNFMLRGWSGMAFENPTSGGTYPNQVSGVVDFREGIINMKGGFRVNGSVVLCVDNKDNYTYPPASHTHSYLPLSGGNVTGPIRVTATGGFTTDTDANGNVNFVARLQSDSTFLAAINQWGYQAFALNVLGTSNSSTSRGYLEFYTKTDGNWRAALRLDNGVPQNGSGNNLLHAGNYSSYALPLSGGTVTGQTYISTSGYPLQLISTQRYGLQVRNSNNSVNSGYGWWLAHDANSNFALHADGIGDILTVGRNGSFTVNGNTVLNAGNYTSYSPSLTGSGASGTWGINVTGNANSASTLNSGATINGNAYFRKNQTAGDYGTAALWTESYGNTTTGIAFHISGVVGKFLEMRTNGTLYWNSDTVLHSGNYSSYALPLSGGTISGAVRINNQLQVGQNTNGTAIIDAYDGIARFGRDSTTKGLLLAGDNTATLTNDYGYLQVGPLNASYSHFQTDRPQFYFNKTVYIDGDIYKYGSSALYLNSSNYSSYALPRSGGALTGYLTLNLSDPTIVFQDTDHRSAMVHVNSNTFYILRGAGTNSSGWATANGYWPLTINLENNNAEFGNALNAVGALTQGGNQVLHAANINSYIPSWSYGVNASHIVQRDPNGYIYANHVNFSTSETENATINSFITSNGDGWSRKASKAHVRNQLIDVGLAHAWVHSDRNFGSGTLIQTDINYAVSGGDPFVLEIRGNSYGNAVPFDIQYQGYIYYDTLINHGGYSNGTNISGLVAINYNGNLCFWFPSQSYWHGYYVRVYVPYATYVRNRVTSISDSGKPTTAKQVDLSAGIRQSLHTGNYTSYAVPQTDVAENGASKVLRTASNGYLYINTWINTGAGGLFSGTNGAHFYPNDADYGAWKITGSRNGWNGIYFDTGSTLMMNSDTVGFHRSGYGWQMRWAAGTGYVHKGNPGGGTEATILDSSNYGSYALPLSGGTVSGSASFTSGSYCAYMHGNGNTGAVAGVGMNVYSTSGNGAVMAFHRGGYYAVNFGLDSDNIMRIGGWSASANRWQLDMSGNMTVAGNVTAYSDERLKKDWGVLPADYVERLAKIKSGTYTRIDSEERQAGVSAQDFQTLLPETVSTDAAGMLSVNYGGAALASAVELAKRVVDQEKRIAHLESLINKLIGD